MTNLTRRINETTEIYDASILMEGAEPCTLFADVARELSESGIMKKIEFERAKDWAFLRNKVLGYEYP